MVIDLSREIVECDIPRELSQPRTRKLAFRFVALPAAGKVHIQPLTERCCLWRLSPVPLSEGNGWRQCLQVGMNIRQRLVWLLLLPERGHDAPRLAHRSSEGGPAQTRPSQIRSEPAFGIPAVAIDTCPEFGGASLGVSLERVGRLRGCDRRLRVRRHSNGQDAGPESREFRSSSSCRLLGCSVRHRRVQRSRSRSFYIWMGCGSTPVHRTASCTRTYARSEAFSGCVGPGSIWLAIGLRGARAASAFSVQRVALATCEATALRAISCTSHSFGTAAAPPSVDNIKASRFQEGRPDCLGMLARHP